MSEAAVESLLSRMKDISTELLQLDLEEEANFNLLLLLQVEQSELRERVDEGLISERRTYTDAEKSILAECLGLEKQLLEVFRHLSEQANRELSLIANGKITRNAYLQEATQINGYFIDSKSK
ncbi:hypothetical protein [Paenibacillus harenae]|uniref:hypothetical protein n=1 Tax=Paenibacillus harenae TaxID=306543 RepID=UPI0003FBDCD4|nr:hypothetical protein [Paenibacillus harenae]